MSEDFLRVYGNRKVISMGTGILRICNFRMPMEETLRNSSKNERGKLQPMLNYTIELGCSKLDKVALLKGRPAKDRALAMVMERAAPRAAEVSSSVLVMIISGFALVFSR